jgi:surfactin synthase thioesterase subunit
MKSSWLVCSKRVARPRARLVCFPYAGGAATSYHGWSVDDDVEVHALALPGRSSRIREAPLRDIAVLLDAVGAELAALEGPLAFYGHSMGALVAWETAHRLLAAGRRDLLGLAVAARGAPDAPRLVETISVLDDRALVSALGRVYGADLTVFRDPELAALLIPAVRADLAMHETWRPRPRPRFGLPVLAFGGTRDLAAPPGMMEGWREFTTGPFEHHTLDAGHFFLETHRAEILARLSAWLRASTS